MSEASDFQTMYEEWFRCNKPSPPRAGREWVLRDMPPAPSPQHVATWYAAAHRPSLAERVAQAVARDVFPGSNVGEMERMMTAVERVLTEAGVTDE